jgi:hypothetical protein
MEFKYIGKLKKFLVGVIISVKLTNFDKNPAVYNIQTEKVCILTKKETEFLENKFGDFLKQILVEIDIPEKEEVLSLPAPEKVDKKLHLGNGRKLGGKKYAANDSKTRMEVYRSLGIVPLKKNQNEERNTT